MSAREISRAGTHPAGGEGREQPLPCRSLPRLRARSDVVDASLSSRALQPSLPVVRAAEGNVPSYGDC